MKRIPNLAVDKRRACCSSRSGILLPLLILLFLAGTSFSFAGAGSEDLCAKLGSVCSEEPSCKIVGGTHMLVWRSRNSKKVLVVCVHGLGLCAKAYKPLADELSAQGFDGYAINVRGFGPDRSQKERARLDCLDTVGDIGSLLDGVRKEHPDYRIVVLGESMGAALAIRVAATYPQLVDAVVCSAPAWKLFKVKSTAAKGIVDLVFYPGEKLGPASRTVLKMATRQDELHKHLVVDPAHKLKLRAGEAAAFLGFIRKTDFYAQKLSCPLLMIQGLNDALVDPRSVAKLYSKIPSSRKKFALDASAEHLILEEGQYSAPVLKTLVSWLIEPHEKSGNTVELLNVPESLKAKEIELLAEIYKQVQAK